MVNPRNIRAVVQEENQEDSAFFQKSSCLPTIQMARLSDFSCGHGL